MIRDELNFSMVAEREQAHSGRLYPLSKFKRRPQLGRQAAALRHLLDTLDTEGGARPTVGLGDSLSDMPFLSLCDWWGMPRRSQLAGAVGRAVGEGER